MTVKCAWASQSENRSINGKKGDQTKLEVKEGNRYYFGQDRIIRFANPTRGKIAAKAIKRMAKNDNIGYGQADRTSLYNECVRIKWDIEKISQIRLCNTDCSELVGCAINFAFKKSVIPSGVTTSTMEHYTVATRKKSFKYVKNAKNPSPKAGDIELDPGHHVIMVVEIAK